MGTEILHHDDGEHSLPNSVIATVFSHSESGHPVCLRVADCDEDDISAGRDSR